MGARTDVTQMEVRIALEAVKREEVKLPVDGGTHSSSVHIF